MAQSPKKQFALDTNVLLDLAAGVEFAIDFKELFQLRGYELLVPPTALFELNNLSRGGDARLKYLAATAMQSLLKWKCVAYLLSESESVMADEFRRRISDLQLIPNDEWNDGLILAEASLAGIPILITSDRHLLTIEEDLLHVAFVKAGLSSVHPMHPRRLLRLFA